MVQAAFTVGPRSRVHKARGQAVNQRTRVNSSEVVCFGHCSLKEGNRCCEGFDYQS